MGHRIPKQEVSPLAVQAGAPQKPRAGGRKTDSGRCGRGRRRASPPGLVPCGYPLMRPRAEVGVAP